MPHPNRPLLDAEGLLEGWTPERIGRRIVTLSETDSTNAVAMASAGDDSADGLAVFADFQSAGRGRQGRSWQAPRGASVLCSVLLRSPMGVMTCRGRHENLHEGAPDLVMELPSERWMCATAEGSTVDLSGTQRFAGRLTLAAALAACQAVRRSTDITPAIKWPNDLRVGRRKLAGILIESRAGDSTTRAWVIGIGINCYQQAGHFPPELRDTATSLELLSAHPVDRASVARELLRGLDEQFAADRFATDPSLHECWMAAAEAIGDRVRVRSGGREYAGRTLSIDPAGGLILQCDDGQRRWFDPQTTSMI